jgi:S1-C subfamily serine protease
MILALIALVMVSCAGNQSFHRQKPHPNKVEVNETFRAPELIQLTRNRLATFRIDILPGGHGTGVVISKEGHLITAYHVVDEHQGLRISMAEADGTVKTYEVKVLAIDKKHDLAVVKIDRQFKNPAVLENIRNINPGDAIYNIGYPHSVGEYVGRGTIGRLGWNRTDFGKKKSVFHDMILADIIDGPGTSGSAVYAEYNGKIIGIITNEIWYKRSKGSTYTMFHGIQSVKYVQELLGKTRVPYLTEFNGEPKSYPPLPKPTEETIDTPAKPEKGSENK